MPFVKLDCGILNSTLWFERTSRELFITALLMAEPHETTEPLPQIAINSLDPTGWEVPPGWYGFVPAASVGIIHRAQLQLGDDTLAALDSLGQPEASSRSKEFEGRRLVRVDGGFIVLNFIKYRDKDATTADRSRRWRDRQKQKRFAEIEDDRHAVSDTPTRVIRHQAEAEAEAEADKRKELVRQKRLPNGTRDFLGWFQAEYKARRNGATYFVRWDAHGAIVKRLLTTFPPDRLKKHAKILLTTNEDWTTGTDRGIEVLSAKINWLEERLCAWEAEKKTRASV